MEIDKGQKKSDNPFKTQTQQKTIKKKIRYCPRYHTGINKGQETIIGINNNK